MTGKNFVRKLETVDVPKGDTKFSVENKADKATEEDNLYRKLGPASKALKNQIIEEVRGLNQTLQTTIDTNTDLASALRKTQEATKRITNFKAKLSDELDSNMTLSSPIKQQIQDYKTALLTPTNETLDQLLERTQRLETLLTDASAEQYQQFKSLYGRLAEKAEKEKDKKQPIYTIAQLYQAIKTGSLPEVISKLKEDYSTHAAPVTHKGHSFEIFYGA